MLTLDSLHTCWWIVGFWISWEWPDERLVMNKELIVFNSNCMQKRRVTGVCVVPSDKFFFCEKISSTFHILEQTLSPLLHVEFMLSKVHNLGQISAY